MLRIAYQVRFHGEIGRFGTFRNAATATRWAQLECDGRSFTVTAITLTP